MARPKLELNEEQVRLLASYGCTYEEMAAIFGCAKDTLTKNYTEIIDAGREDMKMCIRRERLKIALDPEHKQQATMLMFLSKVVLGEKEYAVIDDGAKAPKINISFVDDKTNGKQSSSN